MNLAQILQIIYDSEIHFKIEWVWDGGIDFGLADPCESGFVHGKTADDIEHLTSLLPHYIIDQCPDSAAARYFRGMLIAQERDGNG